MKLHVGLDIGIASVGWAVIDDDEKKILGLGVRTFDKAENPKDGSSLALPRRMARSARRRLRRRHSRMEQLRDLLVANGVVSRDELEHLHNTSPETRTPYELRCEGLDRLLTSQEWTRVLTQLCKRRGYKSMRLGERADDDEGVINAAISANQQLMAQKGYRTAGEMLCRDERFSTSKRNRGDYKGVLSRELVLQEVELLFSAQRTHSSTWASPQLESAYVGLLNQQAPIQEGEALIIRAGVCGIDRTHRRIAAACPTFERFRLIDKLHNVRFVGADGARQVLSEEQRVLVLEAALNAGSAVDYSKIRKLCGLSDDARFVGVRYSRQDPSDLSGEKKEKLPFPKAWHAMRKALQAVSGGSWEALSADTARLDRVAEVLTYYKLDASVREQLHGAGLEPADVEALSPLRFSGNGHLSRETLLAILPFMEDGHPYSAACAAAGLHHSQRPEGTRHAKLPAIPVGDVRNPVVLRALSQSRKVLNAIIDQYGPVHELHVELARDVAKSADDRKKIEKRQKESRATNESVRETLVSDFGIRDPRGQDFVKYKLWAEQGGRCAYSGAYIDVKRLLSGEPGIAEVDHILPHSRSFDDGYMNRVLVSSVENQHKGTRTPFEYLGGDPGRWHEFEELVASMHLPSGKTERLLRTDFDERASDEFRDRNLVDTQYTAKYFKNFVEENLAFAGDAKRPVLTVNGRATAYLRTAWRLQKVRDDGDLHHALDAAVIATTTRSMVQKVSNFFSERPLRKAKDVYVDPKTGEIVDAKHVPEPWDGFASELTDRLNRNFSGDPVADFADMGLDPKPILVSRMPRHTVRGEVHKETVQRIEGEDAKGRIITSKRVKLENLKLKDLKKMVGAAQDRELHSLLRQRLEAAGDDPRKAFAEPVFKPTRVGRVAPRVHAVRVYNDPSSGGTAVRGGLADNGTMVRTDVFEREGRFYLVPVYLKDVAAGVLPNKACVGGKAEKDWRQIDDSYSFRFSLYLNDLVRLERTGVGGSEVVFGCFRGTDRSTGALSIEAPDRTWLRRGLGVALGILAFDKYETNALGNGIHLIRQEKRLGFSDRSRQQ